MMSFQFSIPKIFEASFSFGRLDLALITVCALILMLFKELLDI